MKKKTLYVAQAAMIAAIYVVLTYFISAVNLASGVIQFRVSEALCILPIFTPAAIPGLFIGCMLSNLLTGCVIWDVIFGSLATLIGAFGVYALRKTKFLFTLPPVVANGLIIPFILKYAYGMGDAVWFMMITVSAGEVLSVCLCGMLLKVALWKHRFFIFKNSELNE